MNRVKNFTPISDEEFIRDMYKPGLFQRLERLPAGPLKTNLLKELAHYQRAENGMRARPDMLPNDFGYQAAEPSLANKHGLPTPFTAKETFRPDLEDNPAFRERVKRLDDRLSTDVVTEGLQERMGTDADRPLPPPTLRDQIEAAVAIHSQD